MTKYATLETLETHLLQKYEALAGDPSATAKEIDELLKDIAYVQYAMMIVDDRPANEVDLWAEAELSSEGGGA